MKVVVLVVVVVVDDGNEKFIIKDLFLLYAYYESCYVLSSETSLCATKFTDSATNLFKKQHRELQKEEEDEEESGMVVQQPTTV